MREYRTENHYKTMDNLFSSQRDFIVIGLCGLTGSGCSTVASLLQKDFSALQLPKPGDEMSDGYNRHEYRILHTYAQKNWSRFHRIKTSALITAHVLQHDPEDFSKFLENLYKNNENIEISKICADFFEKKFAFDLRGWFVSELDDKDFWNLISDTYIMSDKETVKTSAADLEEDKIVKDQQFVSHEIKFGGEERASIQCSKTEPVVLIKNRDLYRLFLNYKKRRANKSGLGNVLQYWILAKYIYTYLPQAVDDLWRDMSMAGIPNLAMQLLGINLRIGGDPFWEKGDVFNEKGYTVIAEDINIAIKLLRTYRYQWFQRLADDEKETLENAAHDHTLVVIDSIKNPFESMYLKQRYSNYYLMGIYTEDTEREQRLLKRKKFPSEVINEINQVERLSEFKKAYKKVSDDSHDSQMILPRLIEKVKDSNLKNELPFILQNVESCLDAADIFVNNYPEDNARLHLKRTLLRYVSLIMYPGLVLPTPLERCMQIAYTAKANSGCISRQVGAVITDKDYHLLSIGWNQQPEGQLSCSYRDLCELCGHFSPDAYSDYENDDDDNFQKSITDSVQRVYNKTDGPLQSQGRLPIFCFKDIYNRISGEENQVYPRSLHGEETAFLNLGPVGKERVRGGCLFTTSSPCELCSKKAMYLGISHIYYVEPYSGISYKQVLSAGPKFQRPEFILLTGAVGRAYTQLYNRLLPLKDEHEMWIGQKTEDVLALPKKLLGDPLVLPENDNPPTSERKEDDNARDNREDRTDKGGKKHWPFRKKGKFNPDRN